MSVASLRDGYDAARVSVAGGTVSSNGIVNGEPYHLASLAGVPVDVYSMARMFASEGYGGGRGIVRLEPYIAMGQTLRRVAAMEGKTVTQKVTGSNKSAGAGKYGRQNSDAGGTRYLASTNEPTKWEIAIATEVMNGSLPDLVPGSTNFLAPSVWKSSGESYQAGQKLDKFGEVMTSWHKTKAWMGHVGNIDAYHLAFFKPEASSFVRDSQLRAILELHANRASQVDVALGFVTGAVDGVAEVVSKINPAIVVATVGVLTAATAYYYW